MAKKTDIEKRPVEAMQLRDVQQQILVLRGEQVLLDFQVAKLYGVETRVLKQTVNRNSERFQEDFMFRLTPDERNMLISMGSSQIVIPPITTSAVQHHTHLQSREWQCYQVY